ncbi:MAG: hypothetical protein AAF847_05455 [Bacteroidota bacterium]
MKSICSLFLFIVLFAFTSLAQIDSFDIADYARPDLVRTVMVLQPDFGLGTSYYQLDDNPVRNDIESVISGSFFRSKFVNTLEEQSLTSISGNFNSSFNSDIGARAIRSSSPRILPYLYINSFVQEPATIRFGEAIENQFQNSLWIRYERSKKRFKPDSKQRFFETRPFMSADYRIGNQMLVDSSRRANVHSARLFSDIELYWGKGRIELVNDAWHAIRIIEQLADYGLLKESMENIDFQDFAERISEIKNFRNTDFRLEGIAEYEALCQYLIEKKIFDPSNYSTFAVLRDAWIYESFVSRLSGREFKYGFIPSMELNRNVSEKFNDFRSLDLGLQASVAYNSYRPIRNDWQFDRTYALNFGFVKGQNLTGRMFNDYLDRLSLRASIFTSHRLSYLPNQRHNYAIDLSASYFYDREIDEERRLSNNDAISLERGFLNTSLSATYNYYISPRLFLQLRANFNFTSQHFRKTNNYLRNSNGLIGQVSYVFW